MIKNWKILFVLTVFVSLGLVSLADRGGFMKKNKTRLNISTNSNLKSSIAFNLKSDLNFRGSYLLSNTKVGNSMVAHSIMAYKKGNTTYLLPYKQKMVIPQYTRGEGYKLIIRHK